MCCRLPRRPDDSEQTSAPRRVLFQSADGGILRQFQVNKNSLAYRILMAVVNEAQDSSRNNLDSAQTVAPYKALFQWVDGGILRQIELNKDSEKYRILMAVIKEFQLILTRDDAGPAQTFAPPKKDVPIQPPGSAPVPTSSNSASNPPSSSQTMQRPAQQSTTSNLTTTSASPAFKLDCFSNGRSAPTGRSDANNSSKDRAQSPQSPTNDQSQLTSSSYSRITRSQTRNIENKPGPTNVYLPSRRPRRLRN